MKRFDQRAVRSGVQVGSLADKGINRLEMPRQTGWMKFDHFGLYLLRESGFEGLSCGSCRRHTCRNAAGRRSGALGCGLAFRGCVPCFGMSVGLELHPMRPTRPFVQTPWFHNASRRFCAAGPSLTRRAKAEAGKNRLTFGRQDECGEAPRLFGIR